MAAVVGLVVVDAVTATTGDATCVNEESNFQIYRQQYSFLGYNQSKGLLLRACFCLRKRAFVCIFPFRLICPLDPI